MNIFIEFCRVSHITAKLNKNIQQSFQYPIELGPRIAKGRRSEPERGINEAFEGKGTGKETEKMEPSTLDETRYEIHSQ